MVSLGDASESRHSEENTRLSPSMALPFRVFARKGRKKHSFYLSENTLLIH